MGGCGASNKYLARRRRPACFAVPWKSVHRATYLPQAKCAEARANREANSGTAIHVLAASAKFTSLARPMPAITRVGKPRPRHFSSGANALEDSRVVRSPRCSRHFRRKQCGLAPRETKLRSTLRHSPLKANRCRMMCSLAWREQNQ